MTRSLLSCNGPLLSTNRTKTAISSSRLGIFLRNFSSMFVRFVGILPVITKFFYTVRNGKDKEIQFSQFVIQQCSDYKTRNNSCRGATNKPKDGEVHGLLDYETRCSAIAERLRCRVRCSFGPKWKAETGRRYFTDIIDLASTTVI